MNKESIRNNVIISWTLQLNSVSPWLTRIFTGKCDHKYLLPFFRRRLRKYEKMACNYISQKNFMQMHIQNISANDNHLKVISNSLLPCAKVIVTVFKRVCPCVKSNIVRITIYIIVM